MYRYSARFLSQGLRRSNQEGETLILGALKLKKNIYLTDNELLLAEMEMKLEHNHTKLRTEEEEYEDKRRGDKNYIANASMVTSVN